MSHKVPHARKSVRTMSFGLLMLLLAAVLSRVAVAADLRAYFDRKSVYAGDTVTLVIETTSGTLGEPDLSGLGADFDVLGTSQSTNISIVNGRRTDTVRLLVTLAPQHRGTIEVPPIPVGDEQTEPLKLQVSEVPDGGTGGSGDDIFVELEVGDGSGELMVQQQVPMTVRLYTAVPLLKGNLEDPRAEGALVTKLGEDREYETRRNGREYRVIERSYSLSPEHSGELRIPPVRFEGSVRDTKSRKARSRRSLFDDPFFDRFFQDGSLSGDPFGMFDRGRSVSARSRGATLDVKARPGGYAGEHWLPAQALEIRDSWAEGLPALRVGEPVKRTLRVQAKGLSGSQIPQIQVPAAPGLRVYPEKPESESRSDGETLYGISRQGITFIPTKAGELVMPEIRVTWWDTDAKRERVTTVPSRTLKVTGGAGEATEPQARPEGHASREAGAEPRKQIPKGTPESSDADSPVAGIDRRYLVAGAIALALLIGVGGWGVRRYRRLAPVPALSGETRTRSRDAARIRASEARKALRTACEANDARASAKALLDWAEATWQGEAPRNLSTLAARLAGGEDQVRELERSIYAPVAGGWDGASLWRALQPGLQGADAEDQGQGEVLEPLYPSRGSP